MAKLVYSMITSLDGYIEDEHGRFGWGAPEDEEVHTYINALASSLGTYLEEHRVGNGVVILRHAGRRENPRSGTMASGA